jgi:hypothetical protein
LRLLSDEISSSALIDQFKRLAIKRPRNYETKSENLTKMEAKNKEIADERSHLGEFCDCFY